MTLFNLYLARDTESICLFFNPPVKEIVEEGFYFVDTKTDEFLEIKKSHPQYEELKNHIGVGEIVKLPQHKAEFFQKITEELEFLKDIFLKG